MHSFYSNKNQPFAKADYTIFVAEVASTCNEILLSEYLREQYAGNKQAQIALIGSLLQHFRTTVFRQTMFAEFEYKAHCMAESGESLTRDSLSAMYYDLNKLYYGGACKVDREVAYEWMRIPHFYNSFYVYKYATSFCAAVTLSRGILDGDKEKLAAYRRFLTLGERFGLDDRQTRPKVTTLYAQALERAFPELYTHVTPLVSREEAEIAADEIKKQKAARGKRKSEKPEKPAEGGEQPAARRRRKSEQE